MLLPKIRYFLASILIGCVLDSFPQSTTLIEASLLELARTGAITVNEVKAEYQRIGYTMNYDSLIGFDSKSIYVNFRNDSLTIMEIDDYVTFKFTSNDSAGYNAIREHIYMVDRSKKPWTQMSFSADDHVIVTYSQKRKWNKYKLRKIMYQSLNKMRWEIYVVVPR